jgi:antitoxin (DNA-binding transcriptional repressor) of toxin-antitoxin stability system
MKTLTITDAKKNLGKWLQAAARGEDIGIVSGADVIALRKVEVESTDYAWREYGVTGAELDRFEARLDADYARLKKQGKLIVLTPDDLKKKLGL